MTPGDFYKPDANPKALHFFNSKMMKHNLKQDLGKITSPTNEQIAQAQLDVARALYSTSGGDTAKTTKFLNAIISDNSTWIHEYTTEEVTALLEKWFLNNERIVNVGDKKNNMTTTRTGTASALIKDFSDSQNAKEQFTELLQDLEKIIMIINDYEEKYGAAFLNSSELIHGKEKIEKGIENIKSYLSTGSYVDMAEKTIFGTQKFKSNANPNGAKSPRSAIGQIAVISNQLKGRINEIAAMEAFEKMKIGGLTVVDTALWKIGGKQNYADILIGSNNLTLKCTIGNKPFEGTLKQLQDAINQTKGEFTIYVDDLEWDRIIAAKSSMAAQVKSGVFQNPFNNKSLNLDQLIRGEDHKYKIALAAFVEWYSMDQNIYASSAQNDKTKIYEALANYLISHNMGSIINKNEKILVMRGHIYTTYEYLDSMWRDFGRFIRFIRPVDISKPSSNIPVGVSNKEASYDSNN